MSVATTLSRVTGFVRMWAAAFALGASGLMSAYSVANNIPNMIFELIAGGILSSVFIPTYVELRDTEGPERAHQFASHVANLAALALGLIAIVGIVYPEIFIWTQTFRLTPLEAARVRPPAEFFFRFFAIQVAVYGTGMVMQSVLNAERRYKWVALGPVFNNVVVIASLLAFAFMTDFTMPVRMAVLATGTTLGVVVMFAVMAPSLKTVGFRYFRGLGTKDPVFKHMLALAIPTLIYVATNLVSVSFRNASAYAVSAKGPSVIQYAWTFYQLPYGILAVALATAVFTELASSAGKQRMSEFKATFGRGLRTTLVLMLPSAALLFALAEPLVSLYQVGAFLPSDVPLVASVLRGWAVALVFFAVTMYLLRSFYALKDTRTPMLTNVALAAVHIGLYVLLTTGFGAWGGFGLSGIPMSDAVFYALMVMALGLLLRRKIGGYDLRGVVSTALRMSVAALIGGLAAWGIAQVLEPRVDRLVGTLLMLLAAGGGGLAISFGLAQLMRVSEVSAATGLVRRALGRRGGTS